MMQIYAAEELKKYITTLSRGSVVSCVINAVEYKDNVLKNGITFLP